ncbi:MAG: hypothetical protein Q9M50_02995 [Methylococcales bacterium]|nr:hypothetical protein [Methylococcales bacterium]
MFKKEFNPELNWFSNFNIFIDLGYLGFNNEYKTNSVNIPHKKPNKSKHNPNPTLGYQLKTGQNKELTAIFLYHRLMTKKTEQHRKYAQLVTQLSLKLQQQASKLFVT